MLVKAANLLSKGDDTWGNFLSGLAGHTHDQFLVLIDWMIVTSCPLMIKILLPSKCLKNISQHHCSETCPVSVTSPRSSSMESTSLKKPTPSHPADAQLN